jgi:hypothetical protein
MSALKKVRTILALGGARSTLIHLVAQRWSAELIVRVRPSALATKKLTVGRIKASHVLAGYSYPEVDMQKSVSRRAGVM